MRLAWRNKQLFSELINLPETAEMLRLSKWMSLKSLCSRREAEDFIRLGLVRVDGKRIFENMLVPV
jgi:ribosomal 50S subunit-recycling heat shock protein